MSETMTTSEAHAPEIENGPVNPAPDIKDNSAAHEQQEEQKEPAWFSRRISRYAAQTRDAERQAAALREENENFRRALAASRGEEVQPQRQQTPDEIRADARQQYERQSAQDRDISEFNNVTRKVAQSIEAAHGREAVVRATGLLQDRAGLDFNKSDHRQVIRDIAALPNSGEIYHALANNPDAASELFDATPREQYALLRDFVRNFAPKEQAATAEQDAPLTAPAPVSNAPRPSARQPSGGRESTATIYNARNMNEFIAARGKNR